MNAAKDDDLGIGLSRLAAQFEGVAAQIGQILDFRGLIVMRQDDGTALFGQFLDFCDHLMVLRCSGLIHANHIDTFGDFKGEEGFVGVLVEMVVTKGDLGFIAVFVVCDDLIDLKG
jgi:hypothetical protein